MNLYLQLQFTYSNGGITKFRGSRNETNKVFEALCSIQIM